MSTPSLFNIKMTLISHLITNTMASIKILMHSKGREKKA